MRKQFVCIFTIFLFMVMCVNAQTLHQNDFSSEVTKVINKANVKGKFKGQFLKGKRNGMGIFSFKNGSFYVGDFYHNDFSGFGMMINADVHVKNSNDCFAYVGNWKGNKKTGFGRCYNSMGELIYQGQFENDMPTGKYPMDGIEQTRNFEVYSLESQNISYIGEILENNPHGFGMLVWGNGDIWMGNFKNGEQKGIGLYLQHDGEWETLNFVDGNCDIVSSSVNYRNIDVERKLITRAAIKGALVDFGDALQKFSEIIQDKQPVTTGTEEGDDQNHSGSKSSKGSSAKSSSNKSSGTEASYKNRDSNSYSNYESQLIKMNTYHESQYDDNQRRSIQQKMKNIRTKWESKGYKMFHSQWEDWDGRKR